MPLTQSLGTEETLCEKGFDELTDAKGLVRILSVLALTFTAIWFGREGSIEALAALAASMGAFVQSEISLRKVCAAPHPHDITLFEKFLKEFPVEVATFLAEQDFRGSFQKDRMRPVFRFAHYWQDVEHEFLDTEVEKRKKALLKVVSVFLEQYGSNVFPSDNERLSSEGWVSIPREWQYKYPTRYKEAAKVIHEMASQVANAYDEFVREARQRLRF